MTEGSIAFYVHYHGKGHKHRTEAILKHLNIPATVITSQPAGMERWSWDGPTLTDVLYIDCDIDEVPDEGRSFARDVPALHYAPLWTNTITNRVAQYTNWLATYQPDLVVVDVSAEISMLTRLASIPQVVVRQHGDRRDPGHENAYQAAHSLLAPFPENMEDELTPDWVREKTVYVDGFSREQFSALENAKRREEAASAGETENRNRRKRIVVMFGQGGTEDWAVPLCRTAQILPQYDWTVVGKETPGNQPVPANLEFAGWVDSPAEYMRSADIIVTAAGHNSVMEAGSTGVPFIAIAEERPFDEQRRKIEVLEREGLAITTDHWPIAAAWPDLIQRAEELELGRWNEVFRGDGAQQAAEYLEQVVAWSAEQRRARKEEVVCPSLS